jgi:hypothetical protein
MYDGCSEQFFYNFPELNKWGLKGWNPIRPRYRADNKYAYISIKMAVRKIARGRLCDLDDVLFIFQG